MHENFPISPAFRSRNWKGERQRQPNAVIAAIILMALLGCLMPQNLTYLCCAWFLCFCRAANADVFNTCKVSPPKVIRGAFAAAESFVSLFQGVQVAFIGQRDLKFKFLSCRKIEKFGKSHLSARWESCRTEVSMAKYFAPCNWYIFAGELNQAKAGHFLND